MRKRFVLLTFAVAVALTGRSAQGQDADKEKDRALTRLYASAPGGAAGEIVRGGVPFPRSMDVRDLSGYALWRPRSADRREGEWVPVQWSVTARHDGVVTDTTKPVRWALAQFPAFEGPYELRGDYAGSQPGMLAVENPDEIVVDTGALRFSVPRDRKFAPLRGLVVRAKDRDGKDEDRVAVADGSPGLDVVMTLVDRDAAGNVVDHTHKLSETAIQDVAIEENGPWRTVIRLRGKFQDKEGRPLLSNYLGYSMRIWADRGSDRVRVFFTLENNGVYGPPADQSRVTVKPNWIRIRELSLVVPTRMTGERLRGTTADGSWEFTNGAAGADFRLLQTHRVVNRKNEAENFKYTVRAATGWRETDTILEGGKHKLDLYGQELATGTRSLGGLAVDDGRVAVSADVRHFWQSYPKAISFDDGMLKVELWPREPGQKWPEDLPARWGDAYEFEGGRHKTYEVALSFAPPSDRPRESITARERLFQNPPVLTIDPVQVQASNATFGPFALPAFAGPTLSMQESQEHHARMQLGQVDVAFADAQGADGEIPPASLVTQRETRGHALPSAPYDIDMYGYASFGDLPHDLGFSSGHHDWVKGLFLNWLRFGKREFYDIGVEMLRHRYDYDQYHCTDRQDPNWKWYNGFQRFELGFHGARLAEFEPHGEATGNPQATWLEGLLLAYAVTGDPRAMETARENADAFVNYFTVSNALDRTFVRGPLDYFGQLSAMSVGVHQLLAFYEFTGERRYYDVAMAVFENGLLLAEEYYGNQGFFSIKHSQLQVWPVVRMVQPLISVHRLSGDPRALAMLMRVLTFFTEKAYDGGYVDDQGLYLPLQLPYQWDVEDGKLLARRWFIPYNFFATDGFAYAYLATQGEAETFLDWARATYRDGVIFFQAPVHQAVPPGFYSAVSYAPRQYPNSETKNDAWLLSGGQWYLALEQRLLAEGKVQRADKIKFEDWFAVRRRPIEQRARFRPVGWFGWVPFAPRIGGPAPWEPVRLVPGQPTPIPAIPVYPPVPLDDRLPPPPPPARGTKIVETQAPPPQPIRSTPERPFDANRPSDANPVKPAAPDAPQPTGVATGAKGEVSMDDRDAVFSGDWLTVQLDDAHNRSMRTATVGRTSTATYTIPVEKQGRYYVQLWWPAVKGASTRSAVEIGHGGLWDTFHVDQARESGRWRHITEVEAGPQNPVTVRFRADGADGIVLADGVKLVPAPPPVKAPR